MHPIEETEIHYKSSIGASNVFVVARVYRPRWDVYLCVLEDRSEEHLSTSVTNSVEEAVGAAVDHMNTHHQDAKVIVFGERYPHYDSDRVDVLEFSNSKPIGLYRGRELKASNWKPHLHPKWSSGSLAELCGVLRGVEL